MAETPENPLLDRMALEERFGGYEPPQTPEPLPNIPYKSVPTPSIGIGGGGASDNQPVSALKALDAAVSSKGDTRMRGGSIPRPISELTNPRYSAFVPGDYNNEDAYAQGQTWTEKMVNSVSKGLFLTGTTFLQNTVGMVNGVFNWAADGKFSSFYNNDLNRKLDDINVELDRNLLPNYETDVEKNARWYSPDNLFTANFLWNGIVKNLGYAAGSALSGRVFAAGINALSSLPGISRLVSVGRMAETAQAAESSFLAANRAADTYGKIKSLSDKFLRSYNVLNPGGRFVVAGLSTTGEAGFEAFQTLNEKRNELIEQYREKNNGVMPSGEALAEIDRKAEEVGNSAFLLNVGLLTATNYIQFPKILGSSYTSEKGVLNALTRETKEIIEEGGKYIQKPSTKNRVLATLNKIRPYTFSVSEAFEEGAQFAIGKGVNDYYSKKNNNEPTSFLKSLATGFSETFGTDEGMENILIGGFSGAIMQGRGRYIEDKAKARNTAQAIEYFNKYRLSDFTKETIDAVNRGTVLQQEREQLLKKGDVLNSKDKEADYVVNYLSPRIKYGRYDLVRAELADYRALASTDEGFAQLVNEGKALPTDTKEAFLSRLTKLEQTAENVKSLYQSLNLRYGGVVDDKGNPVYSSAVLDKMVYAASKVADYDVRIPPLSLKLTAVGVDVDTVVKDIVEGKVDSFNEAIDKIKTLGNLNEDEKITLGEALEDVAEMSIRRDSFLKEYDEIKKAPAKFQEKEIVVREEDAKKENIKVATRDGDFELEIGKEYYGGAPMRKSKEGVRFQDFSRFTVVGESKEGKIILKTFSSDPSVEGELYEVDKDYFKKQQLEDISLIKKKPNAKFYIESAGTTFDYKLGGGQTVRGTLRYNRRTDKLQFVSVDGKQKFSVTRGDFSPRKGYKQAKITPFGKLTARAQDALNEPVSEEELKLRADAKNEVVAEVMSSVKQRIQEIDERLNKAKERLAEKKKELDDLALTKEGKPRKAYIGVAKKMLKSLSADYTSIQETVNDLVIEKEELENTYNYLQETYENREILPDTYGDLVNSLKDDVDGIKEMISHTEESIQTGKSLLENIQSAIKTLLTSLNRFIDGLKRIYSDVPFVYLDDLQAKVEEYLGEEGAKKYIEERLGFTEVVSEIQDLIAGSPEMRELPKMESQVTLLTTQIEGLEKGLEDLLKQQKIKEALLKEFETAVENYEKRVEEEEEFKKNEAAIDEFLKTEETGEQSSMYDDDYEADPKKSNMIVVTGTTVPTEEFNKATLAPHHIRANTFGFNRYKFENFENLKLVYLTKKNEKQLLNGITQFLKDNGNPAIEVDPNQTIVAVVVEENPETGKITLVGVDGKPLPETLTDEEKLNQAIYQVRPLTLTWSNGDSMFRKDTPKEVVDSLNKQYLAYRKEYLEKPSLETHKFDSSFGSPQLVLDGEGNPDPNAYVPVTDTGLISESQLIDDVVIEVPTVTDVVEQGSVRYQKALGKPFLKLPNGYVPLKNRKLTRQEAETIYEAMVRLATNLLKEENLQSDESKTLVEYLRSMVYWGEPREGKDVGSNSVFFREVATDGLSSGLKLFIKGDETDVSFTPSDIKLNKETIISMLEDTYNNVNSRMTSSDWQEPYTEILSIAKDGTITSRRWPNYQSFLLSKRLPDEEGNLKGELRKTEEIPLATNIRPLNDENDVNRVGIYFISVFSDDTFIEPKVKVKAKAKEKEKVRARKKPRFEKPAKEKPSEQPPFKKKGGVKEPKGKPKVSKEGVFVLDGKTVNKTRTKYDEILYFVADKTLVKKKNIREGIKIIFSSVDGKPIGDAAKAQKRLMAGGSTKEDSIKALKARIYQNILPTVEKAEEKESDSLELVLGEEDEDSVEEKPSKTPFKKKGTAKPQSLELTLGEEEEETTEETAEEKEEESTITEEAEEEEEGGAMELTLTDDDEDSDLASDLKDLNEEEEPPFRRIIEEEIKKYSPENWNKVEQWLKANFPNIPVYRVKNVIQATNGRQAWGMFKDGAIYIYENAEVGTAYHEVFHAVWRMFTDENEQASVIVEFRNRKGSFFDRNSLSEVEYKDATDRQIEERLSEEFRDYVQEGKIPVKPSDGRPYILKLFSDLINFIKEFFTGKNAQSNVEGLFSKIGNGYYKHHSPYHTSLSFAKKGIIDIEEAYGSDDAEYDIATFKGQEVHDIMQQMTYFTLGELIQTNKGLFNLPDVPKSQLYEGMRDNVRKTVTKLYKNAKDLVDSKKLTKDELRSAEAMMARSKSMRLAIMNDDIWNALVEKHQEFLKKYNIEFDDNDVIQVTDENKTKEVSYDATKIDTFKKANSAIKLLLSTLPVTEESDDGSVNNVPSSIGGVMLLPTTEVFVKILNKVHNSANIDDMLLRIKKMAKNDTDYRKLYYRLTKTNYSTEGIDFSNLKEQHDAMLLDALWATFKKQNPDVKNHYILEGDEIQIGEANSATASRQMKADMVNSMVKVIKKGKSKYFKKDEKQKAYVGVIKSEKQIPLETTVQRLNFLKELGIVFKVSDIDNLNKKQSDKFKSAVNGIRKSIVDAERIVTLTGKVLNINKRLLQLAEVKAFIESPEFDSTYFGASGEKKQTYIGTNAASDLFDMLSQIDNLNHIPSKYPQYSYLLTDSFVKNSVILGKMFNLETGERKLMSEDLMATAIVDATINESSGKVKESSKLNYKERFIQEINLNLDGYYLNLVPGDASIEWMMYMSNAVSLKKMREGFAETHLIFKGYFLSELELSRETDRRVVGTNRKTTDLRFFKGILGEELHNKIVKTKGSLLSVYKQYENEIKKATEDYIKKNSEETRNILMRYGALERTNEFYWKTNGLDFESPDNMSNQSLMTQLNMLTVNYMINNIELHKLLYSDPYQYSDELKRIKNFNSPRTPLMANSENMNVLLNRLWNKVHKSIKDIGNTNFKRDYFTSTTLSDVIAKSDLENYGIWEETDGSGLIIYKAYRTFRIRAGNWSPQEERQWLYDVAWEKTDKNIHLSKEEQEIYDAGNPKVRSAYTPLKPIVSGNKRNGKPYNDVMLDKFALYPLSYRVLTEIKRGSNAVKLYNKLQKEDIDYAVFKSGRKVGAEDVNNLYDKGAFNTSKYKGVIKVPFSIMSVQAEVPSKDEEIVTRGSQMTKLITMDFMEGGVPVDYKPELKGNFNQRYKDWMSIPTDEERMSISPIYREIKHNEQLLTSLINKGYQNLLTSLGIEELKNGDYKIKNYSKVVSTLKRELLKREMNDNIISALKAYENENIVIEATPAYQQIRNILYSIADRDVISQKISGGMKVQIPSTLLLETERVVVDKIKKKDGTTAEVYNSDTLEFYEDEDGKRVCEIMVARWFDSNKTDEELIDYLIKTDEGKAILSGLAYRIPTQKQNSIDVFKIKKFLPYEFGDSVVIPSALVKKTGSDFDIDKLTTYFKNVRINKLTGYPEYIKFLDDNNSTLDERYKKYVQSNVRDYGTIKREVRQNSVEYKQLQQDLQDAFFSYKERLQETREEMLSPYSDRLNEIESKILERQDASQEIFEQGFDIFRELPVSIRQQFYDRNEKLNELIQNETIKSFDKTIYFKTFASQWKDAFSSLGEYQIEYTTKDGKKEIQSVNGANVVRTLDKLIDNYDFYLKSIGWTKETIEEFNKNLETLKNNIDEYKDLKEQIKINDLVSPQTNLLKQYESLFNRTLAETFGLMSINEFGKLSFYDQNTKESVENEYIESSQRLASDKANFKNMISPNSAELLKNLSIIVRDATGQAKFDYSSVDNMLNRGFMSNLRHSFVTGKYAIGIAAVNQTNHSLNQRQPIYIDLSKLKDVSKSDEKWLGDGKLKFFNKDGSENFNTIELQDGRVVTTLSMIMSKDDKTLISDVLSQFIDGYVDISKDPWIMQLGATPNVASTFMFLIKAGVPVKDVVMFMNQPIIRDYLLSLENEGYTWLFNDRIVNEVKDTKKYSISEKQVETVKRVPSDLEERLGQEKFGPQERAEQQFMLNEFLKYAKLAEQMFYVTQGSNFDTANFNDPYLVFKKEQALIKARGTIFSSVNGISAVDALLENSFLGNLRENINKMRNALSEILLSDQPRVRNVIEKVIAPYTDLSDREFVKLSQKAVSDFFDWVVQTDTTTRKNFKLNTFLEKALIKDDNYVEQISEFVEKVRANPKHPLFRNHIIKILEPIFSDKYGDNQVNNLKIKNKDNKVYDQNQVIYAFKELKEYLNGENSTLYKKLRIVAVLQSGLSSSPISFTTLLPYEDFKSEYNDILVNLENVPNLEDFYNLNVFERNNWNNDDIIPHEKAKLFQAANGKWYYNTNMNFLPPYVRAAISEEVIPQILSMSIYTRASNKDVIVYQWEDESYSINERKAMRKRGDYSFIKKGLFKKVKDEYGNPVLYTSESKGRVYTNFVFQAMNAWGDSFRANEFYRIAQKSKIDNGFIKVDEVESSRIIPFFEITNMKKAPESKSRIKPKGRGAINNKNKNSCK